MGNELISMFSHHRHIQGQKPDISSSARSGFRSILRQIYKTETISFSVYNMTSYLQKNCLCDLSERYSPCGVFYNCHGFNLTRLIQVSYFSVGFSSLLSCVNFLQNRATWSFSFPDRWFCDPCGSGVVMKRHLMLSSQVYRIARFYACIGV